MAKQVQSDLIPIRARRLRTISLVVRLQVQKVITFNPIFLSSLRWRSSRRLLPLIFAAQNFMLVIGNAALGQFL